MEIIRRDTQGDASIRGDPSTYTKMKITYKKEFMMTISEKKGKKGKGASSMACGTHGLDDLYPEPGACVDQWQGRGRMERGRRRRKRRGRLK